MTRHPATPDCNFKGCARAAYRLGLCREHQRLVPWEVSSAKMREGFANALKLNRKYERIAAKIANEKGRA